MILMLVSSISFLFISFIAYSYKSPFFTNNVYGSAVTENDNSMASAQDTSSEIGFGNVTNLTDNPNDSAYGQVAASGTNVYVAWQDSTISDLSDNNYDIYIKRSVNRGETFVKNDDSGNESTEVQNLSNNPGFSEHPQIAAYNEMVHVAWVDNTLGNKETLFARSIDNGTTFSKATNLSNTTTNSRNVEIAAFENNVYVVWLDEDEQGNGVILFTTSNDGGDTFSNPVIIARDVNNNNDITLPKVAAYDDNLHIAWNVADNTQEGGEIMTGLFYVKSSDQGNTFSPPIKLNNNGEKVGEAQLAAYKNAVYVVWGSSPYDQITSNLFFTKSIDNGDTFSSPIEVKSENFVNPSNVEIMVIGNDDQENESQSLSTSSSVPPSSSRQPQQQQPYLYITGQVPVSNQNEDIFLAFSNDDGETFSEITTNLSENMDISECPSIATVGNNIYVIWQDRTPGNNEILFTKGKI
jgi:hypothetical protein